MLHVKILVLQRVTVRTIRSQMFFKIRVLKYFTNLTEKRACWSLFLKALLMHRAIVQAVFEIY